MECYYDYKIRTDELVYFEDYVAKKQGLRILTISIPAERMAMNMNLSDELLSLYSKPLPATRAGALYSAFSYPTKISPESIAVFIASHTKPGDTILDPFGGSCTTGIATHLCAKPTPEVLELANKLDAPVVWGPRTAYIYELSVLGAFIGRVMCNPPDSKEFLEAAEKLISNSEKEIGDVYSAIDDKGCKGTIRHAIWSDILECGQCGSQISFWDAMVNMNPLYIKTEFKCSKCGYTANSSEVNRVYETFNDRVLGSRELRRKRVLKRIYGRTGKRNWWRPATAMDEEVLRYTESLPIPSTVPIAKIAWGDLYRSGYHKGITHIHHFYTPRNLIVMGKLWEHIDFARGDLQDALKLLILSYNSTHATLMTRVVVKSGQKDFVVTGAQSGVLYISSLPLEKNLFEGLRRKAKTLAKAFNTICGNESNVHVIQGSSTQINLADKSVDYVFTDPPFGDFIPYSEINFLNEVWLGKTTDNKEEVIISPSQNKSIDRYGDMMEQVFKEISRTLTDEGKATVVFHSSKASVWGALKKAYQNAGFQVKVSSVLDKLQGSFKQVTSKIKVKGDPLLLLTKGSHTPLKIGKKINDDDVISKLILQASDSNDPKELTPERLYARFVAVYLKNNMEVPMNASHFYNKARQLLEGQKWRRA